MILGVFLALCAAGAIQGAVFRTEDRLGRGVGIAFVAAAAAAAAAMGSGGELTLGEVRLSATSYAATFLAVAAGSCLLVCLVGAATQPPAQLAPAALAAFGGFGVALTSPDPRVSLMAGAAAATSGAMTFVHLPAGERRDGRLAEIRILGLVVGALMLAAIVVLRPSWTGNEDRAIGLAFLALALAVAVSAGAVPFHVPAAHLPQNSTTAAVALLLVWIPAGLAMLALTWSPFAFGVDTDWMDGGVGLLQAIAVATIVLGGLAALVHDRIDEVVAYSIVSDSGFILLALASRTEVAAEPARLWLLAFVASKTGLVAWLAAATRVFGSPQLGAIRGWLRRTPLLGLGLAAIAVGTLGWPGSDVARARADLVHLGVPSGLGWVGAAAIVLSIGYYGRLLIVGLLRPAGAVEDSWSERPRLGFAIRRERVVASESVAAGSTAGAEPAAGAAAQSGATQPGAASEVASGTQAPEVAPEPEATDSKATPEPGAPPESEPRPTGRRRSKTAAASVSKPSVSSRISGGEGAAPEPETPATPEMPQADSAASGSPGKSARRTEEAPGDAETTSKPRSKRGAAGRSRPGATAGAPPPAVPDSGPDAKNPDAEKKEFLVRQPRTPGPTFRHRLALVWRLNRTLEVSFVVLLAAALSLAIASGSLGASDAARNGIPLGTAAHATPSPTPIPSLPPTQAPLATGTPTASPSPSASGPQGSAGPTASGPAPQQPTPVIK
jgi:NADH:ubiquinone oxidoreductase subunit 2 (subunit N)